MEAFPLVFQCALLELIAPFTSLSNAVMEHVLPQAQRAQSPLLALQLDLMLVQVVVVQFQSFNVLKLLLAQLVDL